jgi:uncharacterized protein YbjT (DUF2867 family)
VFGSTRSEERAAELKKAGVEPVVVDVFDADALLNHLYEVRPEVVIHQLTDLPYALDASKMTAALARNARFGMLARAILLPPHGTPAPYD